MTVNLFGSTRAIVTPAELSVDGALELINKNHARTPLKPEDCAIFDGTLSNQELDAYDTRMAESSIKNYEADFNEGRALMNSHRSGGFLSGGELPMGRIFAGSMYGVALPPNAKYEDIGGLNLRTTFYVQRGIKLGEVSSDDLIKGIEGGTIRDMSVGFTLAGGGQYRCALCNKDLMDWGDDGCSHIPGVEYPEGRAFAWVENAHAREGSIVYAHATPRTYIEKAIRMADVGKLGRRDAAMLEERYGERILGDKTFAVAKKDDISAIEAEKRAHPLIESVTWSHLTAVIRQRDSKLADGLEAAPADTRAAVLMSAIDGLRDQLASLTTRAGLGDRFIEDLITQTVAARTSAEGVGKFDAERYAEALRKSADPEFIRGELESWKRAKAVTFGDGRRPSAAAGQRATVSPGAALYRG